jgi:hypothetical protein
VKQFLIGIRKPGCEYGTGDVANCDGWGNVPGNGAVVFTGGAGGGR